MKQKVNQPLTKIVRWAFLICLFIGWTQLEAQDLRTVVDMALENNPRVKAQHHQLHKANLEAVAAFRETLPTLNFDASYKHVTNVPEIQIPMIGSSIQMGVYDKFETGLSAQYVLFSGFALKNLTVLKNQATDIQEVGLGKTEKQTAFQVIASYRAVQSIILEQKILQSTTERLQLQLKRARSLVTNGMILPVDTLSLTIGLLDFEKKKLENLSNLKTAKQQLQNLVGKEISVSTGMVSALKRLLPDWISQNVSELKTIRLQQDMAGTFSQLAKAEYYPKISLHAAYRYGKPGLDMIADEWMQYGVWGAGLTWNLFRGQADAIKIDAAKADEKRISYLKEAASNQLKLDFDKSISAYELLLNQLRVTEQALELAREKMEIIRNHYEQGVTTVTDYNNANLELTEAELGRSRLMLQIALKFSEIEYKSGKPISEWSLSQ